ncbi:hypothetical protein HXX76_004971 [Chlamydomonas incerta]|uniref:Uncharacterized protein n=1 Tax=Chlamydomonas incerta TaxID=51695 RepID=A0A835W743_CHLIN|nr:hypothetical protein HXX76_004971 [Chlamydomonas incerta]|eukprot:KAG2439619.1 hypothetical protein HXX76_004971 [Chlamydomonas incerta]
MLALVVKFLALPDRQPLLTFLRAKPEAVSIPFISWIADQEATAVGEQKRVLAGICEELVTIRERLDDERMESLYLDSLAAITAGEQAAITAGGGGERGPAETEQAALALAASPEQYAVKLAEVVTGRPVVAAGYGDPVYDLLVQAVPPAALSPQGVKKGHEMAKELAADLRARRKRSVQAMIGRAQLTPEQADRLMAGSNACRILDMLLLLPSTPDRLASLPDCFTPPPPPEAEPAAAGAPGAAASMSAPSPSSDSEELVWWGLVGEALLAELRLLREEVRATWLDSLEVGPQGQAQGQAQQGDAA